MRRILITEINKINNEFIKPGSVVYILSEDETIFQKDYFLNLGFLRYLNATYANGALENPKTITATQLIKEYPGQKNILVKLMNIQRKGIKKYLPEFQTKAKLRSNQNNSNFRNNLASYIILKDLFKKNKSDVQAASLNAQYGVNMLALEAVLDELTTGKFDADFVELVQLAFPSKNNDVQPQVAGQEPKPSKITVSPGTLPSVSKKLITENIATIVIESAYQDPDKGSYMPKGNSPIKGLVKKSTRYEKVLYYIQGAKTKTPTLIGYKDISKGSLLKSPLGKRLLKKAGSFFTAPIRKAGQAIQQKIGSAVKNAKQKTTDWLEQ